MAECRTCHAGVHWLKTRAGKKMCVDTPMSDGASSSLFEYGVHIPHFTTCPNADEHRKPRSSSSQAKASPKALPDEYFEWVSEMNGQKLLPGDDE